MACWCFMACWCLMFDTDREYQCFLTSVVGIEYLGKLGGRTLEFLCSCSLFSFSEEKGD